MLLMGKSTISMAIFHCYVSSPEGTPKAFKALDDFSVETTMVTWGSLVTAETPNVLTRCLSDPQCIILRVQSHKTVQTHQSVRNQL